MFVLVAVIPRFVHWFKAALILAAEELVPALAVATAPNVPVILRPDPEHEFEPVVIVPFDSLMWLPAVSLIDMFEPVELKT